jgi:hypothetical protein
MDPERRLVLAKRLFVGSVVAILPTEAAIILFPAVGIHIVNVLSLLAITFTAWDILQTADVRKKQEGD